ncbi:MAG: RNA polymerase sigma factor [Planctomycetota bacterium]
MVQDVMLRVAQKLPALRDERAVRAWMTTAVLRAISDRLRAERRRAARERVVAAEAAVDRDMEPWLRLAMGERQQWLSARVRELPVQDQALLWARFGDGDSVAVAGARLGLGDDAAHGRLRRVLERLRRAAAEWLHG